ATFVVDGYGSPILDGLLDIVDVDIIAEHSRGGLVRGLDGRAGEADEGGVGKGVAHVAGEPSYEIVLGAVGFVGDDDHVAAIGEERMVGTALLGHELLDGGEDHAA